MNIRENESWTGVVALSSLACGFGGRLFMISVDGRTLLLLFDRHFTPGCSIGSSVTS